MMNAKKCKRLRRRARELMVDKPDRQLMVAKRDEEKFRQGNHKVTAINNPETVRGTYRWLKKGYVQ